MCVQLCNLNLVEKEDKSRRQSNCKEEKMLKFTQF